MKNFKEKFGKIKFAIPIILGLIGLWLIYNFVPNRNLNEKVSNIFFYFCDVWFSYLASKHWWKMARDEKYKKEREEWLALPLDQRSGWWWRTKLNFVGAIVLLLITIALILYHKLLIN